MKRSTAALVVLLALFGAACTGAAVLGMRAGSARSDAEATVRSYGAAVAGGLEVLRRGRGWPESGYDGLALSVETRPAPEGRVAYDVVAVVDDAETCVGAVQGGRDLAEEILVGENVLSAGAARPSTSVKTHADPALSICWGRGFPLTLRFRHLAEPAPHP